MDWGKSVMVHITGLGQGLRPLSSAGDRKEDMRQLGTKAQLETARN